MAKPTDDMIGEGKGRIQAHQHSLLWLARQPSVVKRAAKVALIVGVVLAAINHGDTIMSGTLTSIGVAKVLITFGVPYCVSTFSSVLAIRERSQFIEPQ